jgi:hypothetical protein
VTITTSPPRDVQSSGDIEIGIGNASPAKMRELQRTLSGSHDTPSTNTEKVAGPIPTAPALQGLITSESNNVGQVAAASDDGAYDIGRLATKSDSDETDAPNSGPVSAISPPAQMVDLPAIVVAQQQIQPEERQEEPAVFTTSSRGQDGESSQSMSLGNGGLQSRSQSIDTAPGRETSAEGFPNGSASSDGTLTAANSLATVAASNSQEEVKSMSEAQRRAKEAISMARTRSQRMRKPPVGRPMTVAEMEASDDEYEPGEFPSHST